MSRIEVELGAARYPILIGRGLLDDAAAWTNAVRGRHVLLVTNTVVGPLYAARVVAALGATQVAEIRLPDGESSKTLASAESLFEALARLGATRDATIVALGGGVVGDLSGFAAACWMRGIDFIQVPTTLLAMVDSSVGGKTAVNLPQGKNLVGAFHQPRLVIADTDTLATLDEREYRAGLAEVLKYGAILDAGFFAWIEAHAGQLLARESRAVQHAIEESCRQKAAIVARDERETGDRALLNFGHTFGHAIENCAGYGAVLHGEAVAMGMLLAARLSERLQLSAVADTQRLNNVLLALGLRTDLPPGISREGLLHAMRLDKKNAAGEQRFILWQGVGSALLPRAVPLELVAEILV